MGLPKKKPAGFFRYLPGFLNRDLIYFWHLLFPFVLVCCQSSDTTVIKGVGVDLLSEFTVLSLSMISTSLLSKVNYRTLIINAFIITVITRMH